MICIKTPALTLLLNSNGCISTTIVFEPSTLDFLVSKVGADKIMLGSDWPFPIGDFQPTKVVEGANLSTADKAGILGGNARRVFGLDA